jgi:hypothetical protein
MEHLRLAIFEQHDRGCGRRVGTLRVRDRYVSGVQFSAKTANSPPPSRAALSPDWETLTRRSAAQLAPGHEATTLCRSCRFLKPCGAFDAPSSRC